MVKRKKKIIKLSSKKQVLYDVFCKSFIGKKFEIVDSNNKNQVGNSGVLVFESFNLFYIDVEGVVKKFLKNGLIVRFDYDGRKIFVNGDLFIGTLGSRIKKLKYV